MTEINFLGLPIAAMNFDEVVDDVLVRAKADTFSYIVTPNVDHVVRLDRLRNDVDGSEFSQAYSAAALVLCDSRVLKRLARLTGYDLPLVPGSDLTRALLTDPRIDGCTIAIIGSGPPLVAALERRVARVRFVQHLPPMNVARDDQAMADIERFVADTRADLVLFAIGAPQSEIAAYRCLRANRSRGVALCVGASLEFMVGAKRRAPRWLQRAGMEWAFRLASEPRRLWRRYLIEGPRIFIIWVRRRDR